MKIIKKELMNWSKELKKQKKKKLNKERKFKQQNWLKFKLNKMKLIHNK